MNDEQGLDQKAIDDLLANVSQELPELTVTEPNTDLQTQSVTEGPVVPSTEGKVPQTALLGKNNFISFFKLLKQHATKKRIAALLGLFTLVIASSAIIGYKMGTTHTAGQDPREKIIGQGITVEEKNLVMAAARGDKDMVNAFLETGMSVDALRPSDNWSPLIAASFYKKPEIVKLLLEKDATVNLQDKYGKTALMQAAAMGAEDIVTMLLQYGANPNLQDRNGRTALMEAYSKNQAQIAEILKAAGADPNIQPHKPSANPVIPPVVPTNLLIPAVPSSIDEATRLTIGKVGFVEIGMPLSEVQKKYPAVTLSQKYLDGNKKPVAMVAINGSKTSGLELELSNSSLKLVSTISTVDDQFLTDKQISTKSTVGDIRNQYSVTEAKIIDNTIYLSVRSMKMLFELNITNEAVLSDWLTTGNVNSIPGDLRIKRIIIY